MELVSHEQFITDVQEIIHEKLSVAIRNKQHDCVVRLKYCTEEDFREIIKPFREMGYDVKYFQNNPHSTRPMKYIRIVL